MTTKNNMSQGRVVVRMETHTDENQALEALIMWIVPNKLNNANNNLKKMPACLRSNSFAMSESTTRQGRGSSQRSENNGPSRGGYFSLLLRVQEFIHTPPLQALLPVHARRMSSDKSFKQKKIWRTKKRYIPLVSRFSGYNIQWSGNEVIAYW